MVPLKKAENINYNDIFYTLPGGSRAKQNVVSGEQALSDQGWETGIAPFKHELGSSDA